VDLIEMGWDGVDWIDLGRIRKKVKSLVNAGKLSSGSTNGRHSSSA
jgi:enterochelin esterase-like enzyme